MLDHCRPLDGVVAAEDDRQRRSLGVNLVYRAEAPGEKLLLLGAVALEPSDVATERRDLGLRPLDAVVEPRHIALLLSEPTLRVLDLGEHRRLAAPRIGRLLALLIEFFLRLLKLLLLGLDRVL